MSMKHGLPVGRMLRTNRDILPDLADIELNEMMLAISIWRQAMANLLLEGNVIQRKQVKSPREAKSRGPTSASKSKHHLFFGTAEMAHSLRDRHTYQVQIVEMQ